MAPFYPRRAFLALPPSFLIKPAQARVASRTRWSKRVVPVIDRTAPALDGYVAQKVDQYNAALSGMRLSLRYERGEPAIDCAGVSQIKDTIVVCSYSRHSVDPIPVQYPAGVTWLRYVKRGDRWDIRSALVNLVADAWDTNSAESGYWWMPLGCHEIGHALGLDHSYNSEHSCMEVRRDDPGPVDIAALRAMYGKRKKRR